MISCYCRVRTEEQHLERQIEATRDYARTQLGGEPADIDVYRDKSTGTDTVREGYRSLMDAVGAGEADVVVAKSVNEVRQRFGQEPMSFDRLGEFNKVSPVELPDAPTNEENTTGFRAAVEWPQRTVIGLVDTCHIIPLRSLVGRCGRHGGE